MAVIYLDPSLPVGSSEILRASTGRLKRSFVSCCEWGLHRGRVARPRVSSYLTFPPLHTLRYAVSLCCTFPGVTPAGCYPAPCPMQLGLSSHLFGARPPGSLTNAGIIAQIPPFVNGGIHCIYLTRIRRPQFSHSTNATPERALSFSAAESCILQPPQRSSCTRVIGGVEWRLIVLYFSSSAGSIP